MLNRYFSKDFCKSIANPANPDRFIKINLTLSSAQMFFNNTLCLIYEPSRKNSFQTKIIP